MYTDDTVMAMGIVEVLDRLGAIDQDTLARVFARRYGAEPEITFFESPVIVDNDAQSVQVAAE